MAKAIHSAKVKVNLPNPPDPLEKVTHALEESQRPSGNQPASGAVVADPVNLMAPSRTSCPWAQKKKLDGKQDHDIDANTIQVDQTYRNPHPPIPQVPSYIGTQPLDKYERGRPKSVALHSPSCSHKLKLRPQSVHSPSTWSPGRHQPALNAWPSSPLFNVSSDGDEENQLADKKDNNYEMQDLPAVDEEEEDVAADKHLDEFDYDQDMGEDHQGGEEDEEEWGCDNEEDKDEQGNHSSKNRELQPEGGNNKDQQLPPASPLSCQPWYSVWYAEAGTDYNVLSSHYATNRRCKSPSPSFLANVRNGNGHKSKRQCVEKDNAAEPRTREDAGVMPMAHRATAVVPRGHEAAPAIPQACRGRGGAAVVLRGLEAAPAVPEACAGTAVVPRGHVATGAIPQARGGATVIPRGREAAPAIPEACSGTVMPKGCEATASIPQACGGAAVCQEGVAIPMAHEANAIQGNDTPMSRAHEAASAAPRAHEAAAANLQTGEVACEDVPTHCGRSRYSKNPKGTITAKPCQIGFYPALWTQLLESAKAEVHLLLFLTYSFLCAETAKSGQCLDILFEMVVCYEAEGKRVEAGYLDEYNEDMAQLLFNDIQTFRSEIKKITQEIVPIAYGLAAPNDIMNPNTCLQFIKDKAASLLCSSLYLEGKCDRQKLLESINKVMRPAGRRLKFQQMLTEWAATGMAGFMVPTSATDNDNEFGGAISDWEDKQDGEKGHDAQDAQDMQDAQNGQDRQATQATQDGWDAQDTQDAQDAQEGEEGQEGQDWDAVYEYRC
ncbi:hypothetical protein OG21DRAFT_1491339 [Imleria badia]|nr:hypothetical protein OG21DRAFT_1491339 [Imleria badia]